MAELLERCFEENVADRPADATALAGELARMLKLEPPSDPPSAPVQSAPDKPKADFRMDDCFGRWQLSDGQGMIEVDFRPDGTFTAKSDHPVGRLGLVTEWKGIWHVRTNRLVVAQTHYWAVVMWRKLYSEWMDEKIEHVSQDAIRLACGWQLVRTS
jgi:hypothetical protein